jgi:hypothetical protein
MSTHPEPIELATNVYALDLGASRLTTTIVPGVIEVPRYIAPRNVTFEGKPHHVDVTFLVRCDESGPTCHQLTVDRGVTGDLLRAIPVASIVRGIVWMNLLRVNPKQGAEPRFERYEVADLDDSSEGQVLRAVDEVYRVAAYVGDAPRLAVQELLGTSKATADRRIRAAREAGLLDVAPPSGRGGRINQGA